MKALSLFLLLLIAFAFTISAQPLQRAENLLANKNNSQWSFEENRGQLADENGVVLNDIKYYGRDKGVAVYLRKNKISFVFSKTEPKENKPAFSEATGAIPVSPHSKYGLESPEDIKISTSRIDLELAGANPNAQIVAEEKISYYTNYYLAHTPEEGITHVPHFKKLTYKNIYSNIDLVLYVKEKGMKYEFVVHPKGKVSDIKLSWNGTKPDVLSDGGIKYSSAFGEITESKPFSFIAGEGGREVKSAFKAIGNTVGFEVGKYDQSQQLVIDPMLVWGTYYGGAGVENYVYNFFSGNIISTDCSGNIYITGSTTSTSNIATSGSHQINLGGDMDAFVIKLDINGKRQWGTYYGGNSRDLGKGISTDRMGNIYFTGNTRSKSGIATIGSYQEKITQSVSGFVVKLNTAGNRLWGTYYGGLGSGICTDESDNIYITGGAGEFLDLEIATSGAYQVSHGGRGDAFIAKFDASGLRHWSTYYGGEQSDAGISITNDGNGSIYVIGETRSVIGIASSGAHQGNYAGGNDGSFLVKFNSSGKRQWGTYYGGHGQINPRGITTDRNGNIYFTGTTYSPTGIASPGAHQTTKNSFPSEGFIVKFNPKGVRQWGTYYGGPSYDGCSGIITDANDNVYVIGGGSSTSDISTPGVPQTTLAGGNDAFIVKFNSNGIRQWGTYYGGTGNEQGYGISIVRNNIFIVGTTESTAGIATPGSHQSLYQDSSDIFIVKFIDTTISVLTDNDLGVISIDSPVTNSKCVGNYYVKLRIKNFSKLHVADSALIGWSVNGIIQPYYFWRGKLQSGDTSTAMSIGSANFKAGDNIIKAWAVQPKSKCNNFTNDTLSVNLYFHLIPEANTGPNRPICEGVSTIIGTNAIAGNSYSWTSIPTGFTSSVANPVISPLFTTTYYLTETNNIAGCTKSDSVTITVIPKPVVIIKGDSFICSQKTPVIYTTKTGGTNYRWNITDGNILSGQGTDSILVFWNIKSKSETITLSVTNAEGCSTSIAKKISFYQSPLLDIGPDDYICEDDGNIIKIDAGKEFATYRWHPTGDTTHFLIVRKAGDYFVVVTDKCDNELKDDIKIASRCPVIIYVPSAFTPGSNGLNDFFLPVGNHVLEEGYSFKIYNRWGERIFTSSDYNTGWDGSYKGSPATEGVYLWMLECAVKEGAVTRKLYKSGTVQLLR